MVRKERQEREDRKKGQEERDQKKYICPTDKEAKEGKAMEKNREMKYHDKMEIKKVEKQKERLIQVKEKVLHQEERNQG